MGFLTVDKKKCKQDGICATECPLMLIVINKNSSLPEAIKEAEKKCIKCGHCVSVCPYEALTVANINVNECLPIKEELNLSLEQVEQLIKARRSIRKYKNKKIEKEKLAKLIDIAHYAPTGGNSQLIQWLVINSNEKVQKLAAETIEFIKTLIKNNHPLTEKYNLNVLVERWESGIDGIFRKAPALIVAHAPKEYGLAVIDGTIAMSYLDIVAESLGLGCCWAGFFMIAATQSPSISKLLDLPEGNICTGALMIGYAQNKYKRIPPRKEAKILWQN
jgi:nitroreductase/NAD-dependent dihydropyrimidine dehydrogenase PreA subunit